MKKSRAAISLIVIAVLTGLLGFTALFGFGSGRKGSYHNIKLGLDLAGGASITYQATGEEPPSQEDMSDTIYKLQKRVEEYSTEAVVYQEGNNRINIEIPGISGVAETNAILEQLGRPGSLYFIRETDDEGNKNYQATTKEDGTYGYVLTKTLEECEETGEIVVYGTDVANAEAGYTTDNMNNQQIVVELAFTDEGTKKFAEATARAYEKGETIGIYYDGEFVSVPKVNAVISNGSAIIEGEESIESARTLASTIRIGGLKVELTRLRSEIVGAQLGQNAIKTSKIAGLIGFATVAVFMIIMYLLPGFLACVALGIYVVLIALVLNGFDVTLTLPGIAGILLSIGMAVDANVIIFARIREEISAGSNVKRAIRVGFDKALSAIIDGNVTTLIAAAVLFFLGSGTVKGFAETLAIGIILSMFTALFVTRTLINIFYALGAKSPALYGKSRAANNFKIVGRRRIVFLISALCILIGFGAMGLNASRGKSPLNYSLDFVGGTSTNVEFTEEMSLEEINDKVVPLIEDVIKDANVQVQKVTGTNEVIFKTKELDADQSTELSNRLVEEFGVDKDKITSETISSTISSEMKRDAIVAVLVAMVLMLIYIWFRFKDPRFGVSSVVCLLHDVLIVLAGYALLRVSVGSTFIACMLTIVGYSINATIVIFDRVRENMAGFTSKSDLEAIIDRSVGQTLTRSLFTSLTTFFMVFWLYIFGVSSVKEFALPIMIGIVAGAWSSICIAGSVWFILRKKFEPAKDSYTAEAPKGSGPVVSHNKYSGQGRKLSKKERRQQKQKEIEERNKSKTVV